MESNVTVIIGLTGQTGAGKSTAAMELALEGCAIIDCDVLAHKVLQKNEACKRELVEEFGAEILDDRKRIDRKKLGQLAFASPEATQMLNQITHPHIKTAIREEIRGLKEMKKSFIVLDAPTLLESGCADLCDFIMVVTAPEFIRCRRIMERDGLTKEEAVQRIRAQQPQSFYAVHADYLIDGTLEPYVLSRRIRTILKTIAGGYHG